MWNSLPSHSRHADIGYNDFKRQLKTFLFRQTTAQSTVTLVLCALQNILTYSLTYSPSGSGQSQVAESILVHDPIRGFVSGGGALFKVTEGKYTSGTRR